MEWNIQLKTKGLNQWIADTEQELTAARDLLDILESEEEELKKVWKSSAMEQWEREFHLLLAKIRTQLKEMQKILLTLGDTAYSLAQIEKDMMSAVEKI